MAGARSVLAVLGAAGHLAGSNTLAFELAHRRLTLWPPSSGLRSVVVHWPAPAALNQSFARVPFLLLLCS